MHTKSHSRSGVFKYMSDTSQSSLFRNGKCLMYRDVDGSDTPTVGVDFAAYEVPIADARASGEHRKPSLTANGFELLDQPIDAASLDFFDNAMVLKNYYPACVEVVRGATGANVVVAFDHNIRSASGKKSKKRIVGGQEVQRPAHVVHGDYTLTSAPERLRQLAGAPKSNDTYRPLLGDGETLLDADHVEQAIASGRFAIINLWRNIVAEPVELNPLALCDAATVKPEDLVVFEIHYTDRIGENYFAKHDQRHRWFYYPEMSRDEALLIKQWDSAGEMAASRGARSDSDQPAAPSTFSFHSAFKDDTTRPDAPDRWSMEVRCAVIY